MFSKRVPLNNNIESNKTSFTINPLKFNNSLKENIHILNEASQNINNIQNKNINEKTYSYFKKQTNDITINKFTQTLRKNFKR